MTLKIAATLTLLSVLSLISYGPAQSAPLSNLSAAAKLDAEQADAMPVRWRRGWHVGGANVAPPTFYGGTYLPYPYGGFTGYPVNSCEFPCSRPWVWYRPHYYRWF